MWNAEMGQSKAATYRALMIGGSSLAVFLAESLLCQWHASHPLSLAAAFLIAAVHVLISVLSGMAITRLFWSRSGIGTSVSLILFASVGAIGWIWVPAIVLLARNYSLSAVLVAAIAAVAMAISVRKILPSLDGAASANLLKKNEPRELFAAFLDIRPREMNGWIIAACLYGGLFALHLHSLCAGSFLVALGAFLLTWQLMSGSANAWGDNDNRLRAGSRLARAASIAVMVTMALLLSGFQRQVPAEGMTASARDRRLSGRRVAQQKSGEKSIPDFRGYQRIILWPVPEKKKMIAPVLSKTPLSGFHAGKPLVIHFDGSYWYSQPWGKSRGIKPHVERGSPLTVNIRSTNYIPLIMEAHQSLADAIPLTCCREIRVTIENYDNAPGVISLGVLLTDSTSLGKPTLYLNQQTIVSTEPGRFTVKPVPATEVLSFVVPGSPKIRRFDEMTVFFFPDTERPNRGARIAIQQFELIPR
jgi:hypothetical protein